MSGMVEGLRDDSGPSNFEDVPAERSTGAQFTVLDMMYLSSPEHWGTILLFGAVVAVVIALAWHKMSMMFRIDRSEDVPVERIAGVGLPASYGSIGNLDTSPRCQTGDQKASTACHSPEQIRTGSQGSHEDSPQSPQKIARCSSRALEGQPTDLTPGSPEAPVLHCQAVEQQRDEWDASVSGNRLFAASKAPTVPRIPVQPLRLAAIEHAKKALEAGFGKQSSGADAEDRTPYLPVALLTGDEDFDDIGFEEEEGGLAARLSSRQEKESELDFSGTGSMEFDRERVSWRGNEALLQVFDDDSADGDPDDPDGDWDDDEDDTSIHASPAAAAAAAAAGRPSLRPRWGSLLADAAAEAARRNSGAEGGGGGGGGWDTCRSTGSGGTATESSWGDVHTPRNVAAADSAFTLSSEAIQALRRAQTESAGLGAWLREGATPWEHTS